MNILHQNRAEEPMLFHCGLRAMFPTLSEKRSAGSSRSRRCAWICFGHVEADECGAMNEWPGVAPRTLTDGEALDLGGRRVRYIDTPHVPHGLEAGVLYEETTSTLLCGDRSRCARAPE